MEAVRTAAGGLFRGASPWLVTALIFSAAGTFVIVALPDIWGFAQLLFLPALFFAPMPLVLLYAGSYAVLKYWVLPHWPRFAAMGNRAQRLATIAVLFAIMSALSLLLLAEAAVRLAYYSSEQLVPASPVTVSGNVRVEERVGAGFCSPVCRTILYARAADTVTMASIANPGLEALRRPVRSVSSGETKTFVMRDTPACRLAEKPTIVYDDPCITETFAPSKFDYTYRDTGEVSGGGSYEDWRWRSPVHGTARELLVDDTLVARELAVRVETLMVPFMVFPDCGYVWTPQPCPARIDLGERAKDLPEPEEMLGL